MTSLAARAVGGLRRQRCKVCWNADGFSFNVPNSLWRRVVPRRLRGFVVCLSCFDALAEEKGVDVLGAIHTLFFAGQRTGLSFTTDGATCSCSRPSRQGGISRSGQRSQPASRRDRPRFHRRRDPTRLGSMRLADAPTTGSTAVLMLEYLKQGGLRHRWIELGRPIDRLTADWAFLFFGHSELILRPCLKLTHYPGSRALVNGSIFWPR